jgi:hypothetical protein
MTKAGDFLDSVNEMGEVGRFEDCSVIVNSNDHKPPHVHILKGNVLVAQVYIPTGQIKNISELELKKKGRLYKDYILSNFVKWLKETDPDMDNKVSYLQSCMYLWNKLHPK